MPRKLIILAFAIIGCAAAQFDSATQGPNPQDIATPEPEYIDIDEPLPAPAAAPIPVQARSSFIPAPRPVAQPIPIAAPSFVRAPTQAIPIAAPSFVRAPTQAYLPPGSSHAQGGHVFSPQGGYQYRQVRRRFVYRRRY
ncbi:arabinogalactan protein 1 [Bactrocera tryoni]|uniref:arabinogalactan protein 1 n=1 Tax=Bactrocera tryoni TaxID=59916 RepID=UPI001A978F81|nr:arabinogalactan protein 1 [Bactrocera tryoni]